MNITGIVKYGFGQHMTELTSTERYYSLLLFFVFQCFVKNTVAITKLSVLFVYLDIFPQRRFRILCWLLIAQICVGMIILTITTFLQCRPIQFSWDKDLHGKW